MISVIYSIGRRSGSPTYGNLNGYEIVLSPRYQRRPNAFYWILISLGDPIASTFRFPYSSRGKSGTHHEGGSAGAHVLLLTVLLSSGESSLFLLRKMSFW